MNNGPQLINITKNSSNNLAATNNFTLNDEKIVSFFYGCYPIEKITLNKGRWFSNNVELKVENRNKYELLVLKSINQHNNKRIAVIIQNKKNLEYVCFFRGYYEVGDKIEIVIPLLEVEKIKITSDFYCFKDERINDDNRKLSFFIEELMFIKEKQIFKQAINYLTEADFDLYEPVKLNNISIFNQNKNVSIVSLKYNERNLYFNSCIFSFQNKKYLLTRHSSFVSKYIANNTLKLFDYDTLNPINLEIKDEILFEQYEDPRVLIHENKIYVSCANYVHEKNHLIHQKILVFDENFNHIKSIHPEFGYNGKSILKNLGREKNWTYFIHDDRLFCIYTIDPHVVVEFDWSGNVISKYVTDFNCKNYWKYGLCRGGTNPIYKDGYMHCFFHSSVPWNKTRRKYVMGYYKFEAKPPFNIVEINEKPILWGNEIDPFILKEINPPVIFPCGAILEEDHFIISFGINDEKTGIIKI